MKSMWIHFYLIFLYLIRVIKTSSLQEDVTQNEELNSNLIADTPKNLQDLSSQVLIYLGEFLEFPHRDLGILNKYFHQVFSSITPSHILSNQLCIPRLRTLPTCPDLKCILRRFPNPKIPNKLYLSIIANFFANAHLPNVKGALVRIIFESLINNPRFTREELVATGIYSEYFNSPMDAILEAAIDVGDESLVSDIMEMFPGLNIDFIYCRGPVRRKPLHYGF